jgi:hypothetical protein
MTSLRKLALAVALAAAIPSAALAKPCEMDRSHSAPPRPAPAGWQHQSARERELSEIRRELRALEDTRADFYARYAGRPGKVRKFERWYAERRAELEARRDALRHGYYASR